MIMGQKVDAAMLRANATPQGFQLKGDVKIAGAPVSLEYRKVRGEPDAEVRLQGMLDETARSNLGFEMGEAISGAIPIRLAGRVATSSDREGRFNVEADLTSAQIEGLLPGWAKPSGKPARATFVLATKPQSIRIEDLLIEGAGAGVKGTIDFDGSGEVQSANFPTYGFSDGDRASLKIERGAEGALRVIMRGEVYDGRGFVKSTAGGASTNPNASAKRRAIDADLDMKLAAVVGFNGEALRGVELKMSRRAGEIRSFGLNAKIGRDATLTGDLRGRSNGRQVIYLESSDAGAFFRFTDVYSRMTGGQLAMTMEAPSADNPAQQGMLNVRNFAVHDETQLERAVNNGTQARRNAIDFSGMRVEFTRMPGKVALREGVVRGPLLGGTIDGVVDYGRDDVHLRGTLVPLYGPNNLLGQIPLVGLFMGGDKEGLFGITYEVVGRPGNPVLRINPISALAPGILRKVFEFPANGETGGVDLSPKLVAKLAKGSLSSLQGFAGQQSLDRLEQDVPLAAERQLDHAVRRDIGFADRRLVAGDANVVDHDGVVGDGAPHFAVRGGEPGLDEGGRARRARRQARHAAIPQSASSRQARLPRRWCGRLPPLRRPPRGRAPAPSPRWRAPSSPR